MNKALVSTGFVFQACEGNGRSLMLKGGDWLAEVGRKLPVNEDNQHFLLVRSSQ